NIEEYVEICNFAVENGATYVLTNPLSRFGRGIKSRDKIGTTDVIMQEIRKATSRFGSQIELVNIRFPNDRLQLASCEAGNIIYIFTAGAITMCSYIVFVTEPASIL